MILSLLETDLDPLTSWKPTSLFTIRCYLFPISGPPTGQGRWKKYNLFMIEWIINYEGDPCNTSCYSPWAGSVENAGSHLLSCVHKVFDDSGVVPINTSVRNGWAEVSLGLNEAENTSIISNQVSVTYLITSRNWVFQAASWLSYSQILLLFFLIWKYLDIWKMLKELRI